MDPFALRKLGNSNIMLPQFGFGGAPLGQLFHDITDADAEQTLAEAWEGGVRFYDTSPWYGRGLSEHRLGRFLYRVPREDVLLSTKVGRLFRPPFNREEFLRSERMWPAGLPFQHHHDYTYDGVIRSYEDSLQRLGMDRVDILIIHDLDHANLGSDALVEAHLNQLATGGMRALKDLKEAGRIGAIGAGVNRIGTIPRFLDALELDFFLVALPYTLAEQPVLDVEFPLCEQAGVGVVIGGVFASGILATGPVPDARYNYEEATPEQLERVRRIQAVCESHGVALSTAALQFPLHHPLVASIIPGAFNPDQLRRNLKSMRQDIPKDIWDDLKHQGLIRADAPTP
jgi:D-threo-aldose 1-dehydrogenase